MTQTRDAGHHPLRCLIVEDNTLVGMGLKSQLQKLKHVVVGQAANGAEARALFESETPDLVFMDIRLEDSDGIELAGELMGKRRVPMIIVSAYSESTLIERAGAVGVFGYLIKPVSFESLQAQIEVAVQRFAEHEKLRERNESLAATLETRKLMDKAKGIVMKRKGMVEEEAHRFLQQESQKRRLSLGEISKKIIESEELLGGL